MPPVSSSVLNTPDHFARILYETAGFCTVPTQINARKDWLRDTALFVYQDIPKIGEHANVQESGTWYAFSREENDELLHLCAFLYGNAGAGQKFPTIAELPVICQWPRSDPRSIPARGYYVIMPIFRLFVIAHDMTNAATSHNVDPDVNAVRRVTYARNHGISQFIAFLNDSISLGWGSLRVQDQADILDELVKCEEQHYALLAFASIIRLNYLYDAREIKERPEPFLPALGEAVHKLTRQDPHARQFLEQFFNALSGASASSLAKGSSRRRLIYGNIE